MPPADGPSPPDGAARHRLSADLARTRKVLLDHLGHEETGALPLAQRHLSVVAWKDSEIAARKEFGLSDLAVTVPWSAYEMPPDQIDLAFRHGGALVKGLLAIFGRRFDRDHHTAFRHLPPAG